MNRIIIADDSATARMFIGRCLEIVGLNKAEFLEAANGIEALDILARGPVDLVVTDLNMPGMNGEELLSRMKASPKSNHIPVIVITSVANPEKSRELEEMGAFAVLGKPISPATLLPAVSPLFGGWGK